MKPADQDEALIPKPRPIYARAAEVGMSGQMTECEFLLQALIQTQAGLGRRKL